MVQDVFGTSNISAASDALANFQKTLQSLQQTVHDDIVGTMYPDIVVLNKHQVVQQSDGLLKCVYCDETSSFTACESAKISRATRLYAYSQFMEIECG